MSKAAIAPRVVRNPLASAIASLALFVCVPSAQAQTTLTGTQTLTVGNGQSYSLVYTYDNSTLNLLPGGTITNLLALGSSNFNMSGGNMQTAVADGSGVTFNLSGGTFSGYIDIETAANANLSGVTVNGFTLGGGNANISGGTYNGSLQTLLSGTATLTGTSFAVLSTTPGTVDTPSYLYNGTYFSVFAKLQNNTAAGTYTLFDATYRTVKSNGTNVPENGGFILNDTVTGNRTSLNANAATPEPATFLLFVPGAMGMLVAYRRRVKMTSSCRR